MAFSVSVGQAIQFLFRRSGGRETRAAPAEPRTTWISRGNRSDFDRVHFKWKEGKGEMGKGRAEGGRVAAGGIFFFSIERRESQSFQRAFGKQVNRILVWSRNLGGGFISAVENSP